MKEWKSVKRELPERNMMVYGMDDTGRIYEAAYFGPVIGWVDLKRRAPVYITRWSE